MALCFSSFALFFKAVAHYSPTESSSVESYSLFEKYSGGMLDIGQKESVVGAMCL